MINEIIEKAVSKSVDDYIYKLLKETNIKHNYGRDYSFSDYIKTKINDAINDAAKEALTNVDLSKDIEKSAKEILEKSEKATITISRY